MKPYILWIWSGGWLRLYADSLADAESARRTLGIVGRVEALTAKGDAVCQFQRTKKCTSLF